MSLSTVKKNRLLKEEPQKFLKSILKTKTPKIYPFCDKGPTESDAIIELILSKIAKEFTLTEEDLIEVLPNKNLKLYMHKINNKRCYEALRRRPDYFEFMELINLFS